MSSSPQIVEVTDDLTRILRLPRRAPIDYKKDPVTKLYAPATQALIEMMTERYRRPRLSCACRPRRAALFAGDVLTVFRLLPEGHPPAPPLQTTVRAFVADCESSNAAEAAAVRAVVELRPGDEAVLPAADGEAGHACIDTFNAVQAWALWEFPTTGGGLGMLGVGCGKSAIFLLLPLAFNCRLAVLLIEPNQRKHYLSQYLRLREHFRAPSITFDDGVTHFRVPGTPPLHIVPYSKLGNPASPEILDLLDPDLLLADEGHRLAGENNSTSRRRQRRFVAQHYVRFVPASGTLEDKSVKDTQPLVTHALGMGSPLPLDPDETKLWSLVMDPSTRVDRTSKTSQRLQVAFGSGVAVAPDSVAAILACSGVDDEIRTGFQKWRAETPGVISAVASGVGVPNYMEEHKPPKMPKEVKEALTKVRIDGIRPDGDIIVGKDDEGQSMQTKVAREVGNGYFYYWRFTGNKCTCPPDVAQTGVVCPGCFLINDWFEKRKRYGKELRSWLLQSQPHFDSPKMCMNAAMRAEEDKSRPAGLDVYCVTCREAWPCGKKSHLPAWRSEFWKDWGEIRDKVPHTKCVKWIDDFVARDAAEWALANRGVVWCASTALGQKVAEIAGLHYHAGGPGSEEAIRAETGKKSVIASLKAHGKGLDGLQLKFNEQYLLEMPSSNRIIEQWLGRLDREGQKADAIYTKYCIHVAESREAFLKVRARAEFNYTMSGNLPKIMMVDGDW